MQAHCEVELDIFSGMPNPHWNLSDAEADSFVHQLASLRRLAQGDLHGNLGYRGFIVQLRFGSTAESIRIQTGIVEIWSDSTLTHAEDVGRRLERWLLNSGKPYLKIEIFHLVEREIL
jgi:hypothetical protein